MGLLDRVSFTKKHADPPEAIDVTEQNEFRILWPGGPEVTIPPCGSRDFCPCASCVSRGRTEKILDAATIPPPTCTLVRIDAIGGYAIQIQWSGATDTGIYTAGRRSATRRGCEIH